MKIKTIKCQQCGAPLTAACNSGIEKCAYCGCGTVIEMDESQQTEDHSNTGLTAVIALKREQSILLCARALHVYIDGIKCGKIGNGKELELTVLTGCHRMTLKCDYIKSNELHFQLADREKLKILVNIITPSQIVLSVLAN